MFIDTHCHLDMLAQRKFEERLPKELFPKVQGIIKESVKAGVTRIINVGTNLPMSQNSVALSEAFDEVFACVGIHPCDCKEGWRKDLSEITELLTSSLSSNHGRRPRLDLGSSISQDEAGQKKSKIIGVGEIGLDFYHKPFDAQRQKDAFKAQIELALECGLPVSVHIRESVDESLKIMEEFRRDLRGVLHCFCQTVDIAHEVVGWGLLLGVGGPLTYPKNSFLREAIRQVPLESLVLETDAPFLPPQEHRGKENIPAYIPIVAQEIANIRGIEVEEVARQTTANAERVFF
jgi:TatD DNase family protein